MIPYAWLRTQALLSWDASPMGWDSSLKTRRGGGMDRGGSEELGGAIPLPQRRRPELSSGRICVHGGSSISMIGRRRSEARIRFHISELLERVKPERQRTKQRQYRCATAAHAGGSSPRSARLCGRRSRNLDEVLVITRSQQDRHAGARSNRPSFQPRCSSSSRRTRSLTRQCCRRACIRCGRSSTAPQCGRLAPLRAIRRVRDLPAPRSDRSACQDWQDARYRAAGDHAPP